MQVVHYCPIIHLLIVIDQIRDKNSYYCYGISLKKKNENNERYRILIKE